MVLISLYRSLTSRLPLKYDLSRVPSFMFGLHGEQCRDEDHVT